MEPKPPDTQQAQPSPSYVETIPAGALVKTGRTERKVKFYAFQDSDLDYIGNLSFELNALVAIGGTFFGVAVTAASECLLTEEAKRLLVFHTLLGVAIVAIALCAFGVWKISSKRVSIIEKIKRESVDI